jgi:WD40 repeat protein
MGVVFKARQVKLNRLVALKMILAGGHERFRTEAEAIARLQHPNIVQVHEIGEHEGNPYFSLEFCPGGAFDRRLAGNTLPAAEAARFVETLARAVQSAHDAQVIHRDLKPANILLTADGTPKISDFGLAKKLDDAGQTRFGEIMGTPSYMAPEQAEGKPVGPPADVYALGAILYECLTGRPPFKAPTTFDTIVQLLADDPVPPRQLQQQTPRDIETICLKCLAKDPTRRYPRAADLADDLGRFQRGEPIMARPVGRVERAVKWVRRNAVVAGLLSALILTLLAGLAISISFAFLADREAVNAKTKAQEAKENAEEADAEREKANIQTREALENLYVANLQLAGGAWRDGDVGRLNALLDEVRPRGGKDLRGLEWGLLRHSLFSEGRVYGRPGLPLSCMAFRPGTQEAATGCIAGKVRLWDLSSGASRLVSTGSDGQTSALAFSPSGAKLAAAFQAKVVVWDVKTAKEIQRFPVGRVHPGGLALLDEKHLLVSTVGPAVGLACFDLVTTKKTWEKPSKDIYTNVSLTGDRSRFAACRRGEIVLCDATTGNVQTRIPMPDNKAPFQVVVSSKGATLAAVTDSTGESGFFAIEVWDVARKKNLGRRHLGLEAMVSALAFSADDKSLYFGDADGAIHQFDVATLREMGVRKTGTGVAGALEIRGDSLAAACSDGTLRIWSPDWVAGGERLKAPLGAASLAAWQKDGRLVAIAWGVPRKKFVDEPEPDDAPGIVQIIDPVTRGVIDSVNVKGSVRRLAFLPSDRLMIASATAITVYKGKPLKAERSYEGVEGDYLSEFQASPDGRWLAALSDDDVQGRLTIWKLSASRPWLQRGRDKETKGLAFHPNGKMLAVPDVKDQSSILLLDVEIKTATKKLAFQEADRVWFSPDGERVIATARPAYSACSWETKTGKVLREISRPDGKEALIDSQLSPDGKFLVLQSLDPGTAAGSSLEIWDTVAGEQAFSVRGFSAVNELAFTPDGRRLITAEADGLRIWEMKRGRELLHMLIPGGVSRTFASPMDRNLLSVSADKALIWRSP